MQVIQVTERNSVCLYVCLCVYRRLMPVIARAGWGDKTPLQCGVVVNWFWLQAKSPHRHLFVFSTRPEKRLLSLKPHTTHPIHCDSSQSLAKMQV